VILCALGWGAWMPSFRLRCTESRAMTTGSVAALTPDNLVWQLTDGESRDLLASLSIPDCGMCLP
jgi:hypothetical protein